MNNGQNNQSSDVYSIPGMYNTPHEQNQEAGQTTKLAGRDPRNIGGSAISSVEISGANQPPDQRFEVGQAPVENQAPDQQLGMDTFFSPDPTEEPLEQANKTEPTEANLQAIRTDGNSISKTALKAVEQEKAELSQTGNAANFYDGTKEMREAYLKNSYGRKAA